MAVVANSAGYPVRVARRMTMPAALCVASRRRAYQNAEVVHLASDDEEPAETWMQYAVHRYRLIGSARHPTEPVTTATVIIVHPAPRYRYTHTLPGT